jgi:uncharacterized sulfatase
MPFPRAKANGYDNGIHVPLAISFPKNFPGGRIVEDPVSFIDFAPTILELTETNSAGMLPISGKSILNILKSEKQGVVDESKKYVFSGRERHSSSRYLNWGYPQRVIRSKEFLLIWNLKYDRWPAGAPRALVSDNTDEIRPLYGIDENGKHVKDWAFTDAGPGPTKSFLIENWQDPGIKPFFDMAFSKRPEYELYNLSADPDCLNNVSGKNKYSDIEAEMKEALKQELVKSGDPRIVGPDKEVFDSYIRYSPMRYFPAPTS